MNFKHALGVVALIAQGCTGGGTYVHVDMTGSMPEEVAQIEVALELSGEQSSASWAGPIHFPTDAVLEVRKGSGALSLSARALAADGRVIAIGDVTGTVVQGQLTMLALNFQPLADSGELIPEDPSNPIDPATGPATEEAAPGTAPAIALSATVHSFGHMPQNTCSTPFVVTLTNNGTASTDQLSAASTLEKSFSAFSLDQGTCGGAILPPGFSCTFSIKYCTGATTTASQKTIEWWGGGANATTASITVSGTPLTIDPPSEEEVPPNGA